MLQTLLEIGRALRNQPGAKGLRHHRYVRPAPPLSGEVTHLTVNVDNNMRFNFAEAARIDNENMCVELYYLNYKSSDQDSLKKYIFGDICRVTEMKTGAGIPREKEANFYLGDPESKAATFKVNSFYRGAADAAEMHIDSINAFRSCLEGQMGVLLGLVDRLKSVYVHFQFDDGRHWYQMQNEFDAINTTLLSKFVKEVPDGGFALEKSLYKTIGAGKDTVPGFDTIFSHRAYRFDTLEEVTDLLFAVDVSQRAMLRKGDVKIVVLPRGIGTGGPMALPADTIESFLQLDSTARIADTETDIVDHIEAAEDIEEDAQDDGTGDELSEPYRRARVLPEIAQFDFILSKASASATTPDIDLVELSGVDKSRIGELHDQTQYLRADIGAKREARFEREARFARKNWDTSKLRPLSVLGSLAELLDTTGKDKRKFSSHVLKVVPKIYAGTYIDDPILLPALIDMTARSVRDGSPAFDRLRYCYLFLIGLQHANRNSRHIESEDSLMPVNPDQQASFALGQCLGEMARPLRTAINSFEKNYVGQLSRRIAHLDDAAALHNFIAQKLVIHNKLYTSLREASGRFCDLMTGVKDNQRFYDKEYCALGFFEAYFAPYVEAEQSQPDGQGELSLEANGDEN